MQIVEEDQVVVVWVLVMQGIVLSISIQQLNMKMAKLIQTSPTPFWGGIPRTS